MHLPNIIWLVAAIVADFVLTTTSSEKILPKDVEHNLLSLFGFERPMHIGKNKIDRRKVVIPQAMLEMYERQTGYKLDTASLLRPGLRTKSANTVRSFTHIESPVDSKFMDPHRFRLKFDINSIPKGERLKAAELTLTRQLVNHLADHHRSTENIDDDDDDEDYYFQHVLVSDIVKPGIKGKRDPIMRLIDSKLVDVRKNRTLSMDVQPAVDRWMTNPKHNYGILVSVVAKNNNNKGVVHRHVRLRREVHNKDDNREEEERNWSNRQPLLFTYTDDGKHRQAVGEELAAKRARRASARRRKGRKDLRENCKRHTMYVDFAEVGWNNWIVAPPGYDAFYCHGECNFPLPEHLNTTNHAIVQTLVNSVSPTKVPKPCCVPTQLNSISMLYLDEENKVVLKNYKEMAVIGCGCR